LGISVTAGGEDNGRLRVVAGSHRAAVPVEIARTGPHLPVVGLPTEPGDLTVHLSCTLHESTAPRTAERKVVYTGFGLPTRPGPAAGGRALSELRERVHEILRGPDAVTR
jgi:Phytanoyl-CoA dioxygenase (PhyH)